MRLLHFSSLICIIPFIFGCEKEDQGNPNNSGAPTSADSEFTYSIDANNPYLVTFEASRSDYENFWSFGDGDTASGYIVSHTYSEVGDYNVTLQTTNSFGSNTSSQSIKIEDESVGLYSGILTWNVLKKTFFGTVLFDGTVSEGHTVEITRQGDIYFHDGQALQFPGSTDTWTEIMSPPGHSAGGINATHVFDSAGHFINVNGNKINYDYGGYTWTVSVSGILTN